MNILPRLNIVCATYFSFCFIFPGFSSIPVILPAQQEGKVTQPLKKKKERKIERVLLSVSCIFLSTHHDVWAIEQSPLHPHAVVTVNLKNTIDEARTARDPGIQYFEWTLL